MGGLDQLLDKQLLSLNTTVLEIIFKQFFFNLVASSGLYILTYFYEVAKHQLCYLIALQHSHSAMDQIPEHKVQSLKQEIKRKQPHDWLNTFQANVKVNEK